MPVKNYFLFIAYFLSCSSQIISQQFPFISYTPVDGLVNNRVHSMYQDSKGRLYFATFGGLSVYDGARFINYAQAEGLKLPVVNDLLEITPDSFWIATNSPELNCLVHGKIKKIFSADGFYPIMNRFFKSAGGTIYIGADEGLFVWQNGRFTKLPLIYNGQETGNFLVQIQEAGNFLVLLINDGISDDAGAILLYDTMQKKVVFKEKKSITSHMTTSPVGDIWLIGNYGVRVLSKEMLKLGLFRFQHVPEAFSSIGQKQGSFITFDVQGQLWLSEFNEGLFLVKPWATPVSFTETSGLASTRISFIFHDKEGNNWFIPEGKGVQKLMRYNLEFLNRPYGISSINDLYANINSDSIWMYAETTGQVILSAGGEKKFFQTPFRPLIRGHVIAKNSTVFLYNEKSIYRMVATRGGKLKEVKLLYQDSSEHIGYGNIDPNGNFIYCTDNLLRVFFGNKKMYDYPIGYFADQMSFDQKGRLWIATRSNRLLVFSLHPEDPGQYLKLAFDLSNQMKLTNPRSLTIDAKGDIWIGTRLDGLYCFRLYKNQLTQLHHFTRKEGLTDNFINYLVCNANNTIWASSPGGIDKLEVNNNEIVIENITQSNNLFLSVKKIMVDRSGTSWGVGESGTLLKIFEMPKNHSTFTPRLYLTQIKSGKESYTNVDSIRAFSYFRNNLQFSVAAPSFIDEKEIKYSYLLSGSGSKQWSEPSPTSDFNFINLPPGSYTLQVKATFPAKRYNEQSFSYSFEINPPWWKTIGVRILIGLLAVGLVSFLVRNYYHRKFRHQRSVLEKRQMIEKERTRIATDMHDDLGAGLSRIKFLSESIQFKNENDESITNDVVKIAGYSDEMVEKMGEIVWALNEKNDTLGDLIAFTRSYAVDYLSNHDIECNFLAPDELPLSFVTGEFRRNIFLSVKESLHNVVKHARAGTVTIHITIGKNLEVVIHDDGVGIDHGNIRPFSNGLSNIQKRMEEVGGNVEFENNKGTKVTLKVPYFE